MFKILIFGAGSVGTCLGTQLYAAGHDVFLYGRRKLKALASHLAINGVAHTLPPKLSQLEPTPYNQEITQRIRILEEKTAEERTAEEKTTTL